MAKGKRKASSTATGKDKSKNDGVDWIAALAKEASTSASSSKPGTKSNAQILTKSQRIEKRNAKKRRREERKGLTSAASSEDGDHPRVIASNARNRRAERDPEALKALSEDHMDRLSQIMHDTVERINDGKSYKERRFLKPFVPAKKGKATKNQQLSDDLIQPRKKDYGGLGLARPSLLIDLRDVSFIPKLEEEFAEHVAGFFGKQRTKAMKKQLDGNMLWRRLADKKGGKQGNQNLNIKVDGKKLKDMTPDERVEAMIKLDMI